jgi:molybdopterin converting factor small subunit
MNVPVQFYAQLRDITGVSECEVELPSGATVNELLEAIYQKTPALRAQDKSILIGAGLEFVNRGYVIKPGEAISIMPPVQGG